MKSSFLITGLASLALSTGALAQQKNILFIAVDDLRPELGCYGHPLIKSPHIDELAATGTRFSRSYCNIAVCGASRASLMSGVRPGVERFVGHDCYLDLHLPGAVSLPMHLRNNGYQTFSLGKVFHHQNDSKGSWDVNWHPQSESKGTWRNYVTPENIAADTGDRTRGMPYEKAEVADEAYFDGKIAAKAIDHLKNCAKQDKPFFMAVGFLKPHLPFNAPSKYWDLYPESEIRLPENRTKPLNAPDAAMHTFGELRAYAGIPATGPVPDEMARNLIRGYYACVSYTDAQVGKLLKTLDELGLRENTIVVLWGDHGWHLGEHGLWCKHCNFEKVLHTPLIIRAPGFKAGVVANQLVEYVDIYPTLCDLTGLVKPFQLQGNSLTPLLNGETPPWKEAVFCRWVKGETIITQTHSYTEWFQKPGEAPFARMLYEHSTDPGENVNVAEHPDNKKLTESLHQKIVQQVADRERVNLPKPVKNQTRP